MGKQKQSKKGAGEKEGEERKKGRKKEKKGVPS